MITLLSGKNFQVFKRAEFKLGRVTTFTGKTGTGKSSALRMLTWVLTNQPPGDEFLGEWGEAPFVQVKADVDGHTVARRRSRAVNSYALDGQEFKSFLQGVPKPIADVVNVGETNFQGQFDPPLWFLDSAGEVSKRLNAIINLSLIDDVLTAAGSEVRQAKAEVSVCEQRITEAQAKVEELKWAKDLNDKLDNLDKLHETWQQLRLKGSQAAETRAKGILLRDRVRGLSWAVKRNERVVRLAEKALEAAEEWRRVFGALEQGRNLLLRVNKKSPDPARLADLYAKWKEQHDRLRVISTLVQSLETTSYQAETARMMIESEERQLKKLTKGRCPLCDSPLRP